MTKKTVTSLYLVIFSILLFNGCATIGDKKTFTKNNEQEKFIDTDIEKDMDAGNRIIERYKTINIEKQEEDVNLLSKEEKHMKDMMSKDVRFGQNVSVRTYDSMYNILLKFSSKLGFILQTENGVDLSEEINFQFNGNFYDLIKTICMKKSYGFEYRGNNKIVIKAYDTRTYNIDFPNITQNYNLDFSSSSSGSSSSGSNGENKNAGQSTKVKSSMEEANIWEGIKEELPSILSNEGNFSINKMTGTVSVTDRIGFLKRVDKYFKNLNNYMSKAVFLDVKLIEIQYSEGYEQGFDWNANDTIGDTTIESRTNLIAGAGISDAFQNSASNLPASLSLPVLTFRNSDNVIQAIAGVLKTKGHMNIKSQPKQIVLNGQPAIIPVGQMITYVKSISKDTGEDSTDTTEYSFETGTIQTGMTLQFLPKISDKKNITLNLGVVLNRLDEMKTVDVSGTMLELPQTSVRATSTTVKLRDGQTMLIGGLVNDTQTNNDRRIPFLGNIPILGNFFKYQSESVDKTELIIVISAHVIEIK